MVIGIILNEAELIITVNPVATVREMNKPVITTPSLSIILYSDDFNINHKNDEKP